MTASLRVLLAAALVTMVAQSDAAEPAHSPRLTDFAYGISLDLEPEGLIYEVALPDSVYLKSTRPDLADLRVYNGAGEALPQFLRDPDPKPTPAEPPVAVPFFPLTAETGNAPALLGLSFEANPDGSVLRLRPAPPPGAALTGYLLDLSALNDARHKSLRLEWSGAPPTGFVAEVAMEASSNLSDWQKAGRSAVADLELDGRRLTRTELVPHRWDRYLRLNWPRDVAGTRITGVSAVPASAGAEEAERRWHRIDGVANEVPGIFEFSTPTRIAIDRVRVVLPRPNTLIPAVIESRPTSSSDWQPRFRGPVYELHSGDIDLVSEAAQVPGVSDPLWRLRVLGDRADLGTGAPSLELGWIAKRLLFLARGTPPFTLAFGSGQAGPSQPTDDTLPRLISQGIPVKMAHLGELRVLSGEEALAAPPKPVPWQRLLLWGILFSSVGLLGVLAYRLYRKIGSNPPRP